MPTYNNGAGYFLYVGDISEVYNYNVPSGGTMFFMNKNQPVLYLKSVNMFNQQTITEYELVEKKIPQVNTVQNQVPQVMQTTVTKQDINEYITRGELETIIADTIRSELRNNRGYKNNRKEQD